MVITRTPYRISFFGGGTDYSGWFSDHGSSIISMGIDKYCHLYLRDLPPFFAYRNRVVWSKIEQVDNASDIQHPAIRTALIHEEVSDIELHHIGDLPARSGLGSSSSFAVGLLHGLRALRGGKTNKYDLAVDAIHLERELLGEAGGIQDQIAAAYGGFNCIEISKSGSFKVEEVSLTADSRHEFEQSLLLVFTGIFRNSFEVAAEQLNAGTQRKRNLEKIADLTQQAKSILRQRSFVKDFGELLNETWSAKKAISGNVSNSKIDEIYSTALECGAYGGKLLGAGAGGFMVFLVPEKNMCRVRKGLAPLIKTSVKIDSEGTQAFVDNWEGQSSHEYR